MRQCTNCGAEFQEPFQFCPHCGTALSAKERLVDRKRVLSVLNSLPGYKRILQNCRIVSYDESAFFDFIMVHEAGVFAFQICESYRLKQGNDRMRFWEAERFDAPGESFRVERPVSTLEKEHRILDQALRRQAYARTFAYLIYPDDAGLERIDSNYLDQMLTLSRIRPILMQAIDRYGHAFSNAEVNKVYSVFTNALLAGNRPIPSGKSRRGKGSRKRVRAFAVIVLVLLLVLAAAFVVSDGDLSSLLPHLSKWESLRDRLPVLPKVKLPGL